MSDGDGAITMELDPATEEAEIAEMVRGFLALQARTAVEENRPLRRGAHAKGVCVRAVFEVLDVAEGRDPALAARLAKGIYARPGSYPATVRFSNANPNVNGDSTPDVRGLAFCAELAPSGSAAAGVRQDYSLQSAPTLPFNDVRALVVFAKVFTAPNQAVALGSLPFRDQSIFARTMAAVIAAETPTGSTVSATALLECRPIPPRIGGRREVLGLAGSRKQCTRPSRSAIRMRCAWS